MFKKIAQFFLVALIGYAIYFAFFRPTSEQIAQSFETLIPRLESLGVTGYRNQRWCQVLAYQGKAFTSNQESGCSIVATNLPAANFTPEARAKFEEVADLLSEAKIDVRFVNFVQVKQGKFVYAEFHESCLCRIHYVYNPGYGTPPEDVPNEMWHTLITHNWYRVDEDWN